MTIAVAKTRDKLIDVARLLFARIGVENTTMNDIAAASHKGRRTLYTYFKSKTDIFHAVVESELNLLYEALEAVVKKDIPADEKLLKFISTRSEMIKQVVFRNGTLKARFFRDIWKVENVRKGFDLQEIRYIQTILDEGVRKDIFTIEDTASMATILHYACKGLEVPYIRGAVKGLIHSEAKDMESIVNLMFNGIKKKTL
ncbi:MAG: TetR/AcrR family transcriptional regulator [Dysgonamonadaceae bacterium]|jgi:AcrR family transcriptional regulator|nr:TetR/AcrR family transcriptional regulator [Dysgonamonadaceae bacterium]